MAIPKRHKDSNWSVPTNDDGTCNVPSAQLAVLMDIRDELQATSPRRLANCHRIPRALDAMYELGVEARRRKRAAAAKRKRGK